jgi:predicted lipoprotein with Yx(FWY)xxD motif
MRLARAGLVPLPAMVALAIAACGSSSSSSAGSSSQAAAPSTSATSTASSATASTSAGSSGAAITVTTKHAKKLGTILAAGAKEKTVYLFEADKGSSSACTGACAKAWPPVTGTAVAKELAKSSDLGTITRSDGTTQVTYKGHPLYFFAKDKDDEDAYGQGLKQFGADWYVLAPSGSKIDES